MAFGAQKSTAEPALHRQRDGSPGPLRFCRAHRLFERGRGVIHVDRAGPAVGLEKDG